MAVVSTLNVDDFIGAKTGRDVFNVLKGKTDSTFLNKYIDFFLGTKQVDNIKVQFVKATDKIPTDVANEFNRGSAAVASKSDDGVVIYFRKDNPSYFADDIVVHEVLHGLTMAAINRDPALKKELTDLNKTILNSIRFDRGKNDNSYKFWDDVMRGSPDELLAYGLTSPKFRAELSKYAYDGQLFSTYRTPQERNNLLVRKDAPEPINGNEPTLTLWDRFLDGVRKIFGIEPKNKTAFDKAMNEYLDKVATYEKQEKDYNQIKSVNQRLDEALGKLVLDSEKNGILTVTGAYNKAAKVSEAHDKAILKELEEKGYPTKTKQIECS